MMPTDPPHPAPIGAGQALTATAEKPPLPPAEEIAATVMAHKRKTGEALSSRLPELRPGAAKTVRATLPALRSHGTAVIARFYALLFDRHPALRSLFNTDRMARGPAGAAGVPAQVAALARAIMQYAMHVDDPAALLADVRATAHRHVARGVPPERYNDFGACLVDAMYDVLQLDDEALAAWRAAYNRLAALFQAVEADVRRQVSERAGYDSPVDMTVLEIHPSPNRTGATLTLQPPKGIHPDARTGMFAAIRVNDVPDIGICTLTAPVLDSSITGTLVLHVLDNSDAANSHLLASVQVGHCVNVGLPCGDVDKQPFVYR